MAVWERAPRTTHQLHCLVDTAVTLAANDARWQQAYCRYFGFPQYDAVNEAATHQQSSVSGFTRLDDITNQQVKTDGHPPSAVVSSEVSAC